MGYIAFRIEKIKTTGGLTISHDHNQREGFCENADASRKFMNQQLMPCAPDYTQFYEDRLAVSPVYVDGSKQPRSDAVKAIEMVFRVGAEEMDENPYFDLDRFCEITKKWVCDTFGAENVADLVLHMDEGYGEHGGSLKCAPHIHAVIIPMTKDGRLSASEFFGSKKKMQDMQSEVAGQYKELHLKRGLKGSVAKPHEMRDYYGWVKAAREVDLPEPGEHETARQYATRIKPDVQKIQSQRLDDFLKLQRERDEAVTKLKQIQGGKDSVEEELKEARDELARREKELAAKEQALEKDAAALQQWKDLYRGLSSDKISDKNREAFLRLANVAWTEGREAREAEEREQAAKGVQQSKTHGETK